MQVAAKKAKAEQTEAARKEIAELMAKAKADMDKEGKTDEAEAAKSQADALQKEVWSVALPAVCILWLSMCSRSGHSLQ